MSTASLIFETFATRKKNKAYNRGEGENVSPAKIYIFAGKANYSFDFYSSILRGVSDEE